MKFPPVVESRGGYEWKLRFLENIMKKKSFMIKKNYFSGKLKQIFMIQGGGDSLGKSPIHHPPGLKNSQIPKSSDPPLVNTCLKQATIALIEFVKQV